jgi:hypothetical protein
MPTARREEVRDLNLVDLLLFEHHQQRALLVDLLAGSGGRVPVSFRQLARLLATHESAEEIVLYPVVRANLDDGDRLSRLATEQEVTIKKALATLQRGDLAQVHPASNTRWRAGLQEVEQLLHAHHELEEQQILAALPDFEDAAALGGLASAYKIAIHLTPTRGHRRAPTGPMSNVFVGAPLGVLDRLRGLKYRDSEG